MIVLSASELTRHFGPEPVLNGVTFEIRPGDKVGLVGPNGAGKTTLLRILAGLDQPDSGRVELHPTVRVAYLEQQPGWTSGRTLWDEAHSALDGLVSLARDAERVARAMAEAVDAPQRDVLARQYDRLQHELEQREAYHLDHKVERVLDGLGFTRHSFQQPVELLSGGQQNRLMLARLLLSDPDLMLLDEPSNHLDIEATEWLESFLLEARPAMIVVSHDRYFLDKVTVRTLELFRGTVDDYPGNFSSYWRQKDERLKVQRRAYARQQEMIAKTEQFIRRNHYGQKHAQAKDREKKLARIERIEPPREIAAPAMGFPAADRTGDIVLRAERLAKAYDRPLFRDLSFDILRGQRWGILGPNGTGKTTLLRCLIGDERPDEGRVVLGAGVRVGYYDQLLTGLDPDQAVVDAIRPLVRRLPAATEFHASKSPAARAEELNEPQRRSLLARFGLAGDAVFQPVGSLSGGERSRSALAQLAAVDANFLVLDEPTNHLDLWACDALERSLNEFDGTVIFVSHDRFFLNRVADHVLVIEPTGLRIVEGNYDTYLHLVRVGQVREQPSDGRRVKPRSKEPRAAAGRAPRRFAYRKLADIEAEIFKREARVEELHAALVSPEVLRNGPRVREIQAELAEQQQALRVLYEHWEEAGLRD